MDKPVIIFGAKGIAKTALEIFESNEVVVYGFLDEDKSLHNTEIGTIPVLGDPGDHGFLKLIGQKCEAFVASDDNIIRKEQVDFLKEKRKVMPVNAVHKNAYFSKTASIGHGNFINSGVHMGLDSKLGQHCIVNANALIEQDVVIGDFVQIGTGAIINSNVTIEEGAFIGTGAVIVSGVTIGKDARIGAGSLVIGDVEAKTTVFGNPAQKIDK